MGAVFRRPLSRKARASQARGVRCKSATASGRLSRATALPGFQRPASPTNPPAWSWLARKAASLPLGWLRPGQHRPSGNNCSWEALHEERSAAKGESSESAGISFGAPHQGGATRKNTRRRACCGTKGRTAKRKPERKPMKQHWTFRKTCREQRLAGMEAKRVGLCFISTRREGKRVGQTYARTTSHPNWQIVSEGCSARWALLMLEQKMSAFSIPKTCALVMF